MARVDSLVTMKGAVVFLKMIYDHPRETQFMLLHKGDTVACMKRGLSANMTEFDFSDAEYMGTDEVYFEPVYHWSMNTDRYKFQIYDSQDDRHFMRLDYIIKPNDKRGSW